MRITNAQITALMSVDFDDSISAGDVERIAMEIEREVRTRWPVVKRLFIRPESDAARHRLPERQP